MSAKAISEATGKGLLNKFLVQTTGAVRGRFASVNPDTNWDILTQDNPWLLTEVGYNFHLYIDQN